jgi:acyl carrier protein
MNVLPTIEGRCFTPQGLDAKPAIALLPLTKREVRQASWRVMLLEPETAVHNCGAATDCTKDLPMSDVAERVKKIVIEHLGVDADKVVEAANFIDDLGADSLDTVELVMAFEEEFSVEIPDDAAETIVTVGDAVKFISKNVAA